jgi:hypothetical protein
MGMGAQVRFLKNKRKIITGRHVIFLAGIKIY